MLIVAILGYLFFKSLNKNSEILRHDNTSNLVRTTTIPTKNEILSPTTFPTLTDKIDIDTYNPRLPTDIKWTTENVDENNPNFEKDFSSNNANNPLRGRLFKFNCNLDTCSKILDSIYADLNLNRWHSFSALAGPTGAIAGWETTQGKYRLVYGYTQINEKCTLFFGKQLAP